MLKNIYLSQDISQYAGHSNIVKQYESQSICKRDIVENKSEESPTIQLLGTPGFWYNGIEYLNIVPSKFNMLDSVKSSHVSGDLTAIYTNLNSVNLQLIKLLRSSTNGYLVLMGLGVQEVYDNMIDFDKRRDLYNESKVERDNLRDNLKDLKVLIKSHKKELKEQDLETSRELLQLEKEEEQLSKDIFKNKEIVKNSKVTPASFLIEHLLDFGVYNILRGFEPVFIENDLMILKVSDKLSQGVTGKTVDLFLKSVKDSITKNLSDREKINLIDSYTFSSDIEFTYEVPELTADLYLLNQICEFPDIDLVTNIYMTDSIPVAPIKPHIIASLLASGTAGSLDKDVLIDNEQASIKSVMLQDEKVETIYMNGERIVEKTSTWKPRLGIYNKLRKEVSILRDS